MSSRTLRNPTWMYRTLKAAGLPSTLARVVRKIDGSLIQVGGQIKADGTGGEYWEDFFTDGKVTLCTDRYEAGDPLPAKNRYLSGCLSRRGGFSGTSSIYQLTGGTYLLRTVCWWTSWSSEVRGITQVVVTPDAKRYQVARCLEQIISGALNPRIERVAAQISGDYRVVKVRLGTKESLHFGSKGKERGMINILNPFYKPKDTPDQQFLERLKDMLTRGGDALERRLFELATERKHLLDRYESFSDVSQDGGNWRVKSSASESFNSYCGTNEAVVLDFHRQVQDKMCHLTPQYDTSTAGGVVAVLHEGDRAHRVILRNQLFIPVRIGQERNIVVLVAHKDTMCRAEQSFSVWGFTVRRRAEDVEVCPYDNNRRYDIDWTSVAKGFFYNPEVSYSRAGR